MCQQKLNKDLQIMSIDGNMTMLRSTVAKFIHKYFIIQCRRTSRDDGGVTHNGICQSASLEKIMG